MIYRIRNTQKNLARLWRTALACFGAPGLLSSTDGPSLDVCDECIQFPDFATDEVDDLRGVQVSDVSNAPTEAFCYICGAQGDD